MDEAKNTGQVGSIEGYRCPPGHICFVVPWGRDKPIYLPVDFGLADPFYGQSSIQEKMLRARRNRLRKDDQRNFDDCARAAFRDFRKGYFIAGGKTLGGGILVGGSVYLFVRGAPGIGSAAGIAAAQGLARSGDLEEALGALKVAGMLALTPAIFGVQLLGQGFEEGEANQKKLDDRLADCAKKSPRANHNGAFLNF